MTVRFQVRDQAQTQAWANLRTTAGYVGKPATDLVTVLKPGAVVTIANGSAEADGLTWWWVKTADAQFGWVAEVDQHGAALLTEYDDTDWGRAIAFVLRWEGGLSTDPHDPGGTTKYGISQRAYPDLDIVNLTREQAIAIYFIDYWKASRADELPWPLCLAHFDHAVNAGVGSAKRLLAKSGNDFSRYIELRRAFYRSLDQFPRYGAAWLNRVSDLEKYVSN